LAHWQVVVRPCLRPYKTAFCLQARKQDRLVHVLLHSELEDWLWKHSKMHMYEYPTEAWREATAVPVDPQILVYDVPFPRLRYIVPQRLVQALDDPSWEQVWPVLDGNLHNQTHGTLAQKGDRWVYTIQNESGETLFKQELAGRPGAVLAAAISVPGASRVATLLEWLDQYPDLWSAPGSKQAAREDKVRAAGRDLRAALKDVPVGLEDFTLPPSGYAIDGDVTIEDGALAGVPAK
jgi:hypothetical protein